MNDTLREFIIAMVLVGLLMGLVVWCSREKEIKNTDKNAETFARVYVRELLSNSGYKVGDVINSNTARGSVSWQISGYADLKGAVRTARVDWKVSVTYDPEEQGGYLVYDYIFSDPY